MFGARFQLSPSSSSSTFATDTTTETATVAIVIIFGAPCYTIIGCIFTVIRIVVKQPAKADNGQGRGNCARYTRRASRTGCTGRDDRCDSDPGALRRVRQQRVADLLLTLQYVGRREARLLSLCLEVFQQLLAQRRPSFWTGEFVLKPFLRFLGRGCLGYGVSVGACLGGNPLPDHLPANQIDQLKRFAMICGS
jgi:hypothetical protein